MSIDAPPDHPDPGRRRWMSILARADADRIAALLADCGGVPAHTILRGPEGGLVMVRGRAGGSGSPFNLGEMTVTRCTVRTETGLVGHAYVAGRERRRAELAALVDALMQDRGRSADVEARVIAPLAAAQADLRAGRAAKAGSTQARFFAMQTMRT